MFWALCACLMAIVAAAVLAPLWRKAEADGQNAAAFDLRVYRDQLSEVDRDLARGVLDAPEAERLRLEIGRKVLDADRAAHTDRPEAHRQRGAVVVAALVAVLAGSGGLYLWLGHPAMPDQPLAARLEMAAQSYRNRPSQAEAEKSFTPPEIPADAEMTALIDQLRKAVKANPGDPQGQFLLARYEAGLGNYAAAVDAGQAFIRLREAQGEAIRAEDHARQAGYLVGAAGGIVTPEAEDHINRALNLDPNSLQGLYLAGLLQAENGRPDRTFTYWKHLLEVAPAGANWAETIRPVMGELAWLAGDTRYVPPDPPETAPPGPTADDMAAAESMTPDERAEFIRSMVSGLERRLADEGGTAEEWARLISSLGTLGETAHAREIWAEAQTHFANDEAALGLVDQAAETAGLK